MIVRLYARAGEFVHKHRIPPFESPPDVIVWGDRTFTRAIEYDDAIADPVDEDDPDADGFAYVEAFAYTLAAPR